MGRTTVDLASSGTRGGSTLEIQGRAGRRPSSKLHRQDRRWALFLLGPAVIGLAVFRLYPTLYSLYLSFFRWDGIAREPTPYGWRNYQLMFSSPDFWKVVWNTVYYTVGSVSLTLLISLFLAVLLDRKIRGAVVYRTIFFAPYVTSAISVSLVWMYIFEPHAGLLNWALELFGIEGPRWLLSTQWAMPAVIIVSVWQHIGLYMVIFLAGLQSIPKEPYEASYIDGASTWQQFFSITLPLLTPITFFALIMATINAFRVFDQIYVLTGGGPVNATNVFVHYFYQYGFEFFRLGYASAVATVLFVLVTGLTIVQFYFSRRWVYYEGETDL